MVSIREKREDDLNALRAFFLQARKNTFTWLDTTKFTLLDFDNQTKEERIFVAFSGDHVIGFISLYVLDNFIHHLYVCSKFQKRGVGSELLTKAMDVLGFPIKLKCLEKNIQAMAFYKRRGFCESGTGVSEEGSYKILQSIKND